MTLCERYSSDQSYDSFLEGVAINRDLWHAISRRALVSDEIIARAEATGGRWHLLVLAEDWCGDAVNALPFIAKLAERASNLDLKILGRDSNPDLMDSHLTGGSRSIPVVILLDETFIERAWWGPRPRDLQEWALGAGRVLPKADRYRGIRRWYVEDRGTVVLNEIVAAVEEASGSRVAA